MRVALLAHEFLINIGANDFLKNVIRGLSENPDADLIFLCPRSNERMEAAVSADVKARLARLPYLKRVLRLGARSFAPVADLLIKNQPSEYDFYAEASHKPMEFVVCETHAASLKNLQTEHKIDVFMPSIHILPKSLPYVTYWPDTQPKYYPEFFDDESQRVRDERIFGLLSSGKPMIINSRAAKADMHRFYNANPDQIFDLPFAPMIEFDKLVPRPELVLKYNQARPYFIICNQFWIHKSLETVIHAAKIAKETGIDVDFLFTGRMEEPRKPGYIESIQALVRELGVGDIVKLLGYIPKNDQIELIKGSIAVIQPTLFEGGPGGGSVHDAICVGKRSIVSDIPINRELPLDDGSVILFRAQDQADLVAKMEHVMATSYSPPVVEELYQRGKAYRSRLSKRLYSAIDYALAETPRSDNATS
ncbi:glycosyltransferase [Mesorhizobium sp.]|uniref:glycosyltransferase n=1 Tax=Mesorhizobium sp. TaxID=1871066 RepID=UPI0025F6EA41|nr:glycosyltransferase [Mesorhizobium sp.]